MEQFFDKIFRGLFMACEIFKEEDLDKLKKEVNLFMLKLPSGFVGPVSITYNTDEEVYVAIVTYYQKNWRWFDLNKDK